MANQNEELSLRDSYLQQAGEMLAGAIRIGVIQETDYDKCLFRVAVNDSSGDNVLTDWLPMITTRANQDITWWAYEKDEQVVVLSPSGNLTTGVILGAIYQNKFRPNQNDSDIHRVDYGDGSWFEHDRKTGDFKLYSTGSISANCEKNAVINVGGNADIKINGWGQIVAKDRLLVKSHTQLKLKGPSGMIVL